MRFDPKDGQRAKAAAAVLLASVLAASCGGGERTSNFTASRVLAFGDEYSVIDDSQRPANGSKYSVNATVSATDPTIDCTANPLWIQTVAAVWGLVFPQCNIGTPVPTDTGVVTRLAPVVDPQSRIRAALGARTADLAAQIDAQVADSPIRDGDVATVLVGLYDVLAEYAQYPAVGEPQLIANLTAEGAALGLQVNRLADLGARVIVSTVPDIAFSPFSLAERASHVDTDRAVLIQRLVDAFNTSFRNTIVNDGRQIGLVLLDNFVEAVARNPSLNNFGNVVTGVCDLDQSLLTPPSTLDCTPLTLVFGGNATTFLWADGLHLSAGGQISLGNLAASRARNNPF